MCYRDHSWKQVDRYAPVTLAVSLVGFLIVSTVNGSFQLRSPIALIYSLPCLTLFWASVLVLSLRSEGIVNRVMNIGWLRWVGGLSYGIYVFHVLLAPAYPWLITLLWPNAGRVEGLALHAMFTVVLSFSLAWVSFRFFETPFLKMRHKFSSAIGATKTLPVFETT
jgi:peptidoglycan/LPS O-acetylase OafA/YrhL